MPNAENQPGECLGTDCSANEGPKGRGEAWLQDLVEPFNDRITGRSLARALNVAPSTITKWMDTGRLEFTQLGGRRFLTRSAVRKFFNQSESQSRV
jgi:excisionase family DNA binding protein